MNNQNKDNLFVKVGRKNGEVVQQMLDCIKSIEGNPFKYTLSAFNL